MESIPLQGIYCKSLTTYSRWETRVVPIGNVPLGGNHPIRIQSMTTTPTMDTVATVEQTIRMIEAGCEYVRITAPSQKEAENLVNIKKLLKEKGYTTPLIADIHFTPKAAEIAARIVEKVRINPGNYVDKKHFEVKEYTNSAYQKELERIRKRFVPLVKVCKQYGTAMRIGTNHGSLSDRIMNRYGDTPIGMVESAMEFIRICEEENYHNIVLSMKASNPKVMVQAYRLLVYKMDAENMNYPLHLGVTEAGEGEDGRIKSAIGIGALLEDGLGDTIRVSLTEEPELEIPVAALLTERYKTRKPSEKKAIIRVGLLENHKTALPSFTNREFKDFHPFEYKKRKTHAVENIGGSHPPVVILNNEPLADYQYCSEVKKTTLPTIVDFALWKQQADKTNIFPLLSADEYMLTKKLTTKLCFVSINALKQLGVVFVNKVKKDKTVVLVFETTSQHEMIAIRKLFMEKEWRYYTAPVIIRREYTTDKTTTQLYAATDFGALLLDGWGDGLWLHKKELPAEKWMLSTCMGILQATRTRISRTEYISCPSCGRTLFNLQQTTAKIRAKTSHLKGVKIGIMGCIVNGPGEMADADYGYVGTGVGKITLYKGKEVVQRNIPEQEAVKALIDLIKQHGN